MAEVGVDAGAQSVDGSEQGNPPAASDSARRLGGDLADLRRRSGLSGESLARALKISQAKVSKIERGAVRVSAEDAERMARALGASDDVVDSVIERAVALRQRRTLSRRATPRPPGTPGVIIRRDADVRRIPSQEDAAEREAAATRVLNLETMFIPGLLQTSDYSRHVVNGYFEIAYGDSRPYWQETARAVSVRAERQVRLYEPTKTFEFVMTEAALSSPLLTPGQMLAQVDRIEAAATLENVVVRIVPDGARLRYPAGAGFSILDDDLVLVEAGSTPFLLRERTEVNFHRRLFDHYSSRAVEDPTPLLKKYKAQFAEAARPS
ncbi:MAG: Scr1 family TA system antitoxin-like transcriptional regulator [Frankia sp.]